MAHSCSAKVSSRIRLEQCFHDVIHTKKGRIHHQHALVPGVTYLEFLRSILDFLAAHPKEIVVVELKSDGFVVREDKKRDGKVVVYSMIPSPAELDEVWEEARRLAELDSAREILRAGPMDMGRNIADLLNERKRMIVIDQIHQPGCWIRNDSYGESVRAAIRSSCSSAPTHPQTTSPTIRTKLLPSSLPSRRPTPNHHAPMSPPLPTSLREAASTSFR